MSLINHNKKPIESSYILIIPFIDTYDFTDRILNFLYSML